VKGDKQVLGISRIHVRFAQRLLREPPWRGCQFVIKQQITITCRELLFSFGKSISQSDETSFQTLTYSPPFTAEILRLCAGQPGLLWHYRWIVEANSVAREHPIYGGTNEVFASPAGRRQRLYYFSTPISWLWLVINLRLWTCEIVIPSWSTTEGFLPYGA
jgi:hypothetical protein